MTYIVYILFLIFIIIIIYKLSDSVEKFSDNSGNYCGSCNNRTFGQCINCFNCDFVVDPKNGNEGICVKGSIDGPQKYTNKLWYTGDNFWRYNEVTKQNCIFKPYQNLDD